MDSASALNELLAAFKKIGLRIPLWTQGQGSNLSYKDRVSGRMYIKPSGFRLDQIGSAEDLVTLDLDFLEIQMPALLNAPLEPTDEDRYAELIGQALVNLTDVKRPSMETGFHIVLRRKFVLHFHALVGIVAADFNDEERADLLAIIQKVAPDRQVSFAKYSSPGLELSRELLNHCDSHIIFLHKHGVILNDDSIDILQIWEKIEAEIFKKYIKTDFLAHFQNPPVDRPQSMRMPLLAYFPDLAVFLPRIMKCLSSSQQDGVEQWEFKFEMVSAHLNIYEIWVANWWLYKAWPRLGTLTADEVAKLSGLPLEKFRLDIK